jgi:hypothetical protein
MNLSYLYYGKTYIPVTLKRNPNLDELRKADIYLIRYWLNHDHCVFFELKNKIYSNASKQVLTAFEAKKLVDQSQFPLIIDYNDLSKGIKDSLEFFNAFENILQR